jgi:hypothetical protein
VQSIKPCFQVLHVQSPQARLEAPDGNTEHREEEGAGDGKEAGPIESGCIKGTCKLFLPSNAARGVSMWIPATRGQLFPLFLALHFSPLPSSSCLFYLLVCGVKRWVGGV